ncbi:MAG: glycosyltransferase [Phycisphaerae bacterium]
MTLEYAVYSIVFLLWTWTLSQGLGACVLGVRFCRFIRRRVADDCDLREADGRFRYRPPAVVIMPCCGVDEKLELTVHSLARQNYDDYEVIFTFESEGDPAYACVRRWTEDWTKPPARRVVAGRAENRSQKIHNLLAAIHTVRPDREVLLFLDSDAVPDTDWLGHMVAPLEDDTVGAATGYRWYVADGSLVAGVRCAWNAATVSLLADDSLNLCWGGSTAVRRARFESLRVAQYWDQALSDDLQLTRAIRNGGLRICFVPQALIPNNDRTTLREFWNFARRQVIITRICDTKVWRAGARLCAAFMLGGVSTVGVFFCGIFGWFGSRTAAWVALAGWLVIILLAGGAAVLRQMGLRRVLRPPDLTWRDFLWDVGGTLTFAGSLHLHLMLSSLRTRRFTWRDTEYEMISPDRTRVVRRSASDRSGEGIERE